MKKGDIFERWTVIEKVKKNRHFYWRCRCFCGNIALVYPYNLTNGASKSCGCLRREVIGAAKKTHGQSGTKFYQLWNAMLNRCYNKNQKTYHAYGARGIRVCERWHKFENFLEDMGYPPPNHSIERKNNNGHYEPSNCEWVPMERQALNRRNTVLITFAGKSLTATDWEKITGVDRRLISLRIRKGMSMDRVFSKKKFVNQFG